MQLNNWSLALLWCFCFFFFIKLETHVHAHNKNNGRHESKLSQFGSSDEFLLSLSAARVCPVWAQEEERLAAALFGCSPQDSHDFRQSHPGMWTNSRFDRSEGDASEFSAKRDELSWITKKMILPFFFYTNDYNYNYTEHSTLEKHQCSANTSHANCLKACSPEGLNPHLSWPHHSVLS